MPEYILTESQLNLIKKSMLNEDTGMNTALSLIGIVDPTGIADLINAISYFKQGDNLFGFLSLISVVPYVGDAVGKTAMGAMKAGGKGAKLMTEINLAIKAGDTLKAQKLLTQLSKMEGGLGKLARTSREWAPRVDAFIDRLPGGFLTRGLKNTIDDWLKLFRGAGTQAASIARRLPTKSPKQQQEMIRGLEAMLKREKFLDPAILSKPNFLGKLFYGGGLGMGRVSDIFGKSNLPVRILIGKTKFYAGFLDHLGLGNWVGPEELEDMIGKDEMMEKMAEYERTPKAQEYLKSEFPETEETEEKTSSSTSLISDPVAGFMDVLIKGPQAA